MGQTGCENMMSPGTYDIQWAHGPESNWDWQYWNQLDMKANTKYVLTYDSSGELSIDESEDSSLTGYTVICGKNNGPDELVFCLKPASQKPGTTMTELFLGYGKSGYKVYLDGNYVGADGEDGDALDGTFLIHNLPCLGNHVIVVDDGAQTHTLDYYFGCEVGYSINVEDFESLTEESKNPDLPGFLRGE
jgi:hypothetical protein